MPNVFITEDKEGITAGTPAEAAKKDRVEQADVIGGKEISLVRIEPLEAVRFAQIRQAKQCITADAQQRLHEDQAAPNFGGRHLPHHQGRSRRAFGIHVCGKLSQAEREGNEKSRGEKCLTNPPSAGMLCEDESMVGRVCQSPESGARFDSPSGSGTLDRTASLGAERGSADFCIWEWRQRR